MAPQHLAPPEKFNPQYCSTVHELCTNKMDEIKGTVDDVHDAIFGTEKQNGMLDILHKKLSVSTVRWVFSFLALPAILAIFAFYAFYVEAPLTYVQKQDLAVMSERVIKLEENVKQLPTTVQVKEALRDVLKEHR